MSNVEEKKKEDIHGIKWQQFGKGKENKCK